MSANAVARSVLQTGDALLSVRNLSAEFRTEDGWVSVLDNVNVHIEKGRTLGLVGESGSGKTVTSLAVMGLLGRAGGRVTGGEVEFGGQNLLSLSPKEWRQVRGAQIGMIFQQPRRSLDPAFTVGDQIAETVRVHTNVSRRQAWQRAVEMLDLVGITGAGRRAHDYPHMFSGGMCQRVMIAIALATGPDILIADEPTTALDVTVQAQVLDLMKGLQDEMGLGILFITHDLSVVAEMSDRVAVMYAGQVVEEGTAAQIFRSPHHPYTEALMAAMPAANVQERKLRSIPGQVPRITDMPTGCRFHPRCAFVEPRCVESPVQLREVKIGSRARCVRADELSLRGIG